MDVSHVFRVLEVGLGFKPFIGCFIYSVDWVILLDDCYIS